jgi:hypothetical protein
MWLEGVHNKGRREVRAKKMEKGGQRVCKALR